jgi:glucosamine-6-phosphate deaminase
VSAVDLRRTDDYDDLSRISAEVVAQHIRSKPHARILVATGRTPIGTYQVLAGMVEAGALDVSEITAFQLDEYVGLEPDDHRSLGRWAREAFVHPLGLDDDRFVTLPVAGVDGSASLAEHDRRVRVAGGYDLAILGIGENGHLGFNEPPCDPSAPSRVVTLSATSLASSAGYWGESGDLPRRAVTVGLGPILEAGAIILLVSGARKRAILERALSGSMTPDVPASYLLRARSLVVVADRDAWPARTNDGEAT